MLKFGVGQSVSRSEDERFLTGRGSYTDDLEVPNQSHAYILRSPHANALIRKVDTTATGKVPGVLCVLSGADIETAGLGGLPCLVPIPNADGSDMYMPPFPLMATAGVHYVGEPVAMVVAETLDQARDAAEQIEIEYEVLPAVADVRAATAADAPKVWDGAESNVALFWKCGDTTATEQAFAKADHIVAIDVCNNRLVANSIEPRAGIALYDADGDRYTLHSSTHGPHHLKMLLAEFVFHEPMDKFRIIAPDVGGSFGPKFHFYADQPLILFAAKKIGRPVRWCSDRGEAFFTETHGRDHATKAELALAKDGRFLGLRVAALANLGAYVSCFAPFIPTEAQRGLQTGAYDIPAASQTVTCVFTNTVPVDALRGAGRPESTFVIERLVDSGARELGLDPAELRRSNLVRAEQMPYTTALGGATYDDGDFLANLVVAQQAADWSGFARRRTSATGRGRARGIGMAYYVERASLPTLGSETMTVHAEPTGKVVVRAGTCSSGQGHETVFAQLVVETLEVPFESIEIRQGDTDDIAVGGGTAGSRSLVVGGTALTQASERLLGDARNLAEELLEVSARDLVYADAAFSVVGTDRRIGLFELADPAGLHGTAEFLPDAPTYPNGCHICEVEVDPETGAVELLSYVVADDFGRIVNPQLLAGQVHGGIANGVGQALMEHALYDAECQLLSGSFMDYTIPRARDLPSFECHWNEVLSRANPLGTKGAGEAGAVPSPAAVINAVMNALHSVGVRHVDMPATPQQVRQAIQRTGR